MSTRISPWDERFRRPAERTETIELPELETSLTLREASDPLRQGQIYDLVERYCHLYVAPEPGKKPRMALAGPDGKAVETSRDLFKNVAAIEVMQVVPEGQERWSMLEIIGIAKHLGHRWDEIVEALIRLTNPAPKTVGDAGNSAADGTTPPSATS